MLSHVGVLLLLLLLLLLRIEAVVRRTELSISARANQFCRWRCAPR